MPPINISFCNNCTNVVKNRLPIQDDDETTSNGFPYSLLAIIIPIGILILFSLYIRIQCCIWECKQPRIENDTSSSIDSRSLAYSSVNSTPEFVIQPKPSIFFIKDMNQYRVDNPLEINDVCSICIEAYEEQDLIVTMPCGHQYHKSCIYPWLKSNIDCGNKPTCPMCKEELIVEYRGEVNEYDIGIIIEKNN